MARPASRRVRRVHHTARLHRSRVRCIPLHDGVLRQRLLVQVGIVLDATMLLSGWLAGFARSAAAVMDTQAPDAVSKKTASNGLDPAMKAKMQGYEGEACGECGNYTLVRNGTCMKCNTCGATSGCS